MLISLVFLQLLTHIAFPKLVEKQEIETVVPAWAVSRTDGPTIGPRCFDKCPNEVIIQKTGAIATSKLP